MLYIILAIIALIRWLKKDRITYYFILQFLIFRGYKIALFQDIIIRPDDLALGLILYTIINLAINNSISHDNLSKLARVFIFFIFISFCVSFVFYQIPFIEVFKGSRSYLYVLSLYDIMRLRKEEIEKLLSYIFYFNIIIGTLFSLQLFYPINILTRDVIVDKVPIGFLGIPRSYSYPQLIPFCCLYSFFVINNKWRKTLFLCLSFITLFAIQSRGLIINTVLLIVIGIFVQKSNTKTKTIMIIISIILVFLINSTIFSNETGEKTANDINIILNGDFANMSYIDNMTGEATLAYRFYLVYRAAFRLLNDLISFIFGVGFFVELPLNKIKDLGLENISIESWNGFGTFTPDIAYSNILCNLGFIGSILYLIFFIRLFNFFMKNRIYNNMYNLLGLLYIPYLLILGLNGSFITTPICLFIPFILFRHSNIVRNNNILVYHFPYINKLKI